MVVAIIRNNSFPASGACRSRRGIRVVSKIWVAGLVPVFLKMEHAGAPRHCHDRLYMDLVTDCVSLSFSIRSACARRYIEGDGEEWSRGLGDWYLYEVARWLNAGNILRHTFRNH